MASPDNKTYAIVQTVKTVTKPVVNRVASMAEMEWGKLSNLQEDINFMRVEQNSMRALLAKLGATEDDGDDHLDVQVKEWRDEVRRLSADIDECVDDFTRRVDGGGAAPSGGKQGNAVAAFVVRSAHKVATIGPRYSVATRIKKLKDRVNDVSERRIRYNLDGLTTALPARSVK